MMKVFFRKIWIFLCICAFFPVQAASLGAQTSSNPSPGGANRTHSLLDDAFSSMGRAFVETNTEPTPADLYFLGRAVAANILTAYRPYTVRPELTNYLNLICQAIVVHIPEMDLFNGAYVLVLDSPELNAFASPGGHIFITRGLLEALSTEDMLAAVIAHELAHVKLKHCANMIREMRFYDDMSAIAGRASGFSGNTTEARQLMSFRDSVSSVVEAIMVSGFSQDQEYAADSEALILLALSGYNPRALIDVLEILRRTQNSGNARLNTTHPSPADRIANAERLLGNRQIRDNSSLRASRFINR